MQKLKTAVKLKTPKPNNKHWTKTQEHSGYNMSQPEMNV